MKRCIVCGAYKEHTEFYKREDSPDGYRNDCKVCRKRKSAQWRADFPEKRVESYTKYNKSVRDKQAAYSRQYRKDHPEWERFTKLNYWARHYGYSERITLAEWEGMLKQYNYSCARCGSKENVCMDHIVPLSWKQEGAHSINNIQPLCARCNSSKGARHAIKYKEL